VYSRLKSILVTVEPLIIHRLDMPTSGLLVVAKTKEVHKHIQKQFLKQTVVKQYAALLSGTIEQQEGEVNLPLRGDLDNRPQQLVCFEFGKKAVTRFKVVKRNPHTTKVHFFPFTGRTHQLRMHAAHKLGLDTPIVGDDLYGTPSDRLYLHARYLEFTHPKTGERLIFENSESFLLFLNKLKKCIFVIKTPIINTNNFDEKNSSSHRYLNSIKKCFFICASYCKSLSG